MRIVWLQATSWRKLGLRQTRELQKIAHYAPPQAFNRFCISAFGSRQRGP